MRKLWWIPALVGIVACSGPCAPTQDPMAVFAAAHAHEACLVFPITFGTQLANGLNGHGVLVPIKDVAYYVSQGATVQLISYCNPAE